MTLRGTRMWEFFDRLVSVSLPRVRDFKGVSPKAFDGRGNYSLGIREQIIFPEVDYDKVERITGLNVTVCTTRTQRRRGQGPAHAPRHAVPASRRYRDMMTDPIADMLTRIRNAGNARHAGHDAVRRRAEAGAGARAAAGAASSATVTVEARDGHPTLVLGIRYDDRGRALIDGIRRVSKPGRRVYVGHDEHPARAPRARRRGASRPRRGVLSDREAREQNVGGELLCEVW